MTKRQRFNGWGSGIIQRSVNWSEIQIPFDPMKEIQHARTIGEHATLFRDSIELERSQRDQPHIYIWNSRARERQKMFL